MKKDKIMTICTTAEIYNKIKEISIKEDRSISYIINRILVEYFKKTTPAKAGVIFILDRFCVCPSAAR